MSDFLFCFNFICILCAAVFHSHWHNSISVVWIRIIYIIIYRNKQVQTYIYKLSNPYNKQQTTWKRKDCNLSWYLNSEFKLWTWSTIMYTLFTLRLLLLNSFRLSDITIGFTVAFYFIILFDFISSYYRIAICAINQVIDTFSRWFFFLLFLFKFIYSTTSDDDNNDNGINTLFLSFDFLSTFYFECIFNMNMYRIKFYYLVH